MPAGRMLKKEITPSDKINSISFAAALLFTWAIPFEDSAGYIEAEPRWLKHNVFPARDDMSVNDLIPLIIEIIMSGAWVPFKSKDNGKRYVWDPKFEEKQKARPKHVEADSPFATRTVGEGKSYDIKELHIGLIPIPLKDVKQEWLRPASSNTNHESPPPAPPRKESKGLPSLKKILEENPEMNELVKTLRSGKFPQVGSFLGKCLKEIKGIQVEDLKQTLQAIAEKDDFEGEIFPYAVETLKSIVNENVTRRVEDQSQKFKEEEAGGAEQIGKIFEGMRK